MTDEERRALERLAESDLPVSDFARRLKEKLREAED